MTDRVAYAALTTAFVLAGALVFWDDDQVNVGALAVTLAVYWSAAFAARRLPRHASAPAALRRRSIRYAAAVIVLVALVVPARALFESTSLLKAAAVGAIILAAGQWMLWALTRERLADPELVE